MRSLMNEIENKYIPRDLFDNRVNVYKNFKLYYFLRQSSCDCDGTINSI